MMLTKTLWAAALAVATLLTVAPATPAQAQSRMTISDRGYGDRGDWRRDDRRYRDQRRWHRGRNQYYSRRPGWYGWNDSYRYRKMPRCHTQWRWDRWQGRRVRVRICR